MHQKINKIWLFSLLLSVNNLFVPLVDCLRFGCISPRRIPTAFMDTEVADYEIMWINNVNLILNKHPLISQS
jgi:hypothetical protein